MDVQHGIAVSMVVCECIMRVVFPLVFHGVALSVDSGTVQQTASGGVLSIDLKYFLWVGFTPRGGAIDGAQFGQLGGRDRHD